MIPCPKQQNWRRYFAASTELLIILLLTGSIVGVGAQTWSGAGNLGNVAMGSQKATTITLTNNTANPMTVDTIEVRGISAGEDLGAFLVTLPVTPSASPVIQLAAGAKVNISVIYKPSKPGVISALLTAEVNGIPHDFNLSATALPRPPTNLTIIKEN